MNELIVIGGSAGALEALLALVPALADDVTAPIAIAIHLGANQRNLVPDLLRKATWRTCVEAEDKQPLEPRHIYVAPPNYHLLVERTATLALSVDDAVNFSRPSIDVLFESAADVYAERAIGIVLTGASADGAAGLARIKDRGGVAIVQDPDDAEAYTMPAAAIRATVADAILPLDEIPKFLIGLCVEVGERVV